MKILSGLLVAVAEWGTMMNLDRAMQIKGEPRSAPNGGKRKTLVKGEPRSAPNGGKRKTLVKGKTQKSQKSQKIRGNRRKAKSRSRKAA